MTNNEFPSWTWTDRNGREWEVTETEERRQLKDGENVYSPIGVHTWTFEEGEVTQDLYAYKVEPLIHREDIKVQLQQILDRSVEENDEGPRC
jgi:hypothetical protein